MIGTDFAAENERGVLLGALMANAVRWAQGGEPVSVAISPDRTDSFTNGQWSGWIAVHEPCAEMFLQAGGDAFDGRANTITVLASNDLALAIATSPDPAAIGEIITCAYTVSVSGPAAAEGVVLTNWLPASAEFIEINLSQGQFAQGADGIVCHLGTVTPELPATVTLRLRALTVDPLFHRAVVTRTDADPYPGNNTASAVTTIKRPRITISNATAVEGDAGVTSAVFTVNLSVPSSEVVSVPYATTNGTAQAGSDYVEASGTITFPPGSTTRTFGVGIIGDTIVEGAETFAVLLVGCTNGVITSSLGMGTIEDNDSSPGAGPRLSVRRAEGCVILSWPSSATDFMLEGATVLGSPFVWTAVTNTAVVRGDAHVLTNAVSGTNQFFRLRRQASEARAP
jgi:uncharacterized repeat protein (TIGR01451 family)